MAEAFDIPKKLYYIVMPIPAGDHGQSGFTLLELLLTMAILVLIVGIMGSALQLGIRSWEKRRGAR